MRWTGNVLVTVSDKKFVHANGSSYHYYNADVVNATDYYPFGMIMPNRNYSAKNSYRYGFNGKENDNEVKGEGNEQDYGMRVYDPRIGRFLSVDPLEKTYSWNTPYSFAENDAVRGFDLDGQEKVFVFWNPFTMQPSVICFGCGIKEASDNYMGGLAQKSMVDNGQMSYQNNNVPPRVQQQLNKNNTNEATAKISKGLSQTTAINVQNSADVATLLIPAGEVGDLALKGFSNLLKASPKARLFATKFAELAVKNTPKGELPRAITAIVDKTTGKVYYGKSGVIKSVEELEPRLKEMIPKESLEKWSVTNCAECDALNSALKDGAKVEDLEMHTLKIDKKTGTVSDFERCQNCKVTTKNIKTTSDPKKKG